MKMNKRVLKVAVVSALTVAFAVPAFANPFTDVPAKHWSYDAVNKLAQAGIVDGYGDGTFKGEKTVTRYEMAQMVAKAMTKSLNNDQKVMVEKLSREFSTELNSLGVKVEGLQNQIDNMVKISGDARVRYTTEGEGAGRNDLRARVNFDGKINDSLKFNARLSGSLNPSTGATVNDNNNIAVLLDNMNVTFDALGMTNTVGRQDMKLGSGVLFDDTLNGIASKAGGLKLYYGKTTGGVTGGAPSATVAEHMVGAEYGFNALGGKITADYLKIGENKAYAINASAPLSQSVTFVGDYVKNQTNSATATAYGLKFNNIGLSVTHRNADANVYSAYSSSDVLALPTNVAIKGMEYQYDKALGKNAAMSVKYQDFDNMNARTSAVVNVKF